VRRLIRNLSRSPRPAPVDRFLERLAEREYHQHEHNAHHDRARKVRSSRCILSEARSAGRGVSGTRKVVQQIGDKQDRWCEPVLGHGCRESTAGT
jgi:hypothetical protein